MFLNQSIRESFKKQILSLIFVLSTSLIASASQSITTPKKALLDVITHIKPVQRIILGYLDEWVSEHTQICADFVRSIAVSADNHVACTFDHGIDSKTDELLEKRPEDAIKIFKLAHAVIPWQTMTGLRGPVYSCAYSANGSYLATGPHRVNEVNVHYLWYRNRESDTYSLKSNIILQVNHENNLLFSQINNYLVSGNSCFATVTVWQLQNEKLVYKQRMFSRDAPIGTDVNCAFWYNDTVLCVAFQSWNRGTLIEVYKLHDQKYRSQKTWWLDRGFRKIKPENGEEVPESLRVKFIPKSSRFLAFDREKIVVWEYLNGEFKPIQTIKTQGELRLHNICSIELSGDGCYLVIADFVSLDTSVIKIFRLHNGTYVYKTAVNINGFCDFKEFKGPYFSADNSYLILGYFSGSPKIQFWKNQALELVSGDSCKAEKAISKDAESSCALM